jgi:hypothetical protein
VGITTINCNAASLKAQKKMESTDFKALLTIIKVLAYDKKKSCSASALKNKA